MIWVYNLVLRCGRPIGFSFRNESRFRPWNTGRNSSGNRADREVVGSNPGRVKPKNPKLVVVASHLTLGAKGTALRLTRWCQYNGQARFSPWAPHKCPCAIMKCRCAISAKMPAYSNPISPRRLKVGKHTKDHLPVCFYFFYQNWSCHTLCSWALFKNHSWHKKVEYFYFI